MAYLIGIDEAGYGPNLGPLVISATVWRAPDRLLHADLYRLLHPVVATTARVRRGAERLPIADSKTLYRSAAGLEALERGLLGSLHAAGTTPTTWRSAWAQLCPQGHNLLQSIPWYADFDRPLPIAADRGTLAQLGDAFARRLAELGLQLTAVKALALFPARFNELLDRLGSKGQVLSKMTIKLIAQVLAAADEPVLVQCDKHGGRNKYARLLQEAFPDRLVEIHGESRMQSVYRWGPSDRRIEIRFIAKGERFLPTALASMASKYLRELAMTALNAFWRRHVAGLKPTAGYPADARRFKRQIARRQAELAIPDRLLWRNR